MAVELATAYIALVPSLKGAQGAIAREFGSLSTEANAATGKGVAGGLKGAVALAGVAAIGLAVAASVKGAVELGLSSIDAASALQQSTGAVEAIFGPASQSIKDFGKQAAYTAGLSTNSYQELASVLGAQLKNGGTSIDKLGDKTAGLITLGADLSAQFGGSAKDAVEALSSALRGERDPIERYGVSLTQSAIDAKAAELGFKKVSGALSTQATQAATLSLVYDQTSAAQGTFARESDTLAGQQQRLAAAFDNSKAALGEALLPAATAFVNLANNTLIPIFDEIVAAISPVVTAISGKLTQAFSGASEIGLADILDRISNSPVVQFFSDLFDVIKPYLPTVTSLYTQFSPLSIAFQQLVPYLPQLADGVKQLVAGIAPLIPQIIDLIPSLLELIPPLVELAVAVLPLLPPLIQVLVLAVSGIIQGLKLWAESTKGLFTGLELLFGMLTGTVAIDDFLAGIRAIPGPLGTVLRAVTSAGDAFGAFFFNVRQGIAGFVTGIATSLVGAGRSLIEGFIRGIRDSFGKVRETLASLTSLLPSWKGPQSLDKVILKESGQLVINGFINGLESRYGAVRSSLGDLTSDLVPTAAYAGVTSTTSSAASSGVGSGGFANYGTIVTQDVETFIDKMRKDQRRAQALEGLDGVSIA